TRSPWAIVYSGKRSVLANGRVRRDCDVPAAGNVMPQALVILRLLSADCLMSVSSTYLSPNVEKSYIFRQMTFEPTRPHNDLPSLPPPLHVETTAVHRQPRGRDEHRDRQCARPSGLHIRAGGGGAMEIPVRCRA